MQRKHDMQATYFLFIISQKVALSEQSTMQTYFYIFTVLEREEESKEIGLTGLGLREKRNIKTTEHSTVGDRGKPIHQKYTKLHKPPSLKNLEPVFCLQTEEQKAKPC